MIRKISTYNPLSNYNQAIKQLIKIPILSNIIKKHLKNIKNYRREIIISQIIRNLITGGDDYELIFTVPSNKSGIVDNLSVELGVNLTKIGEIIKKNNSQSVSTFDLSGNMIIFEKTGFRHF